MVPSVQRLRVLLLGPDDRFQRSLDVLLALALFVLTMAAYTFDVFDVTGGLVVLPGQALLVGVVAAAGIGYRGSGLAFGWLVVFAPLFGFDADWAFFGLSRRPLAAQVTFLLDPTKLAVFGVAAVLFGTVGFAVGWGLRVGVDNLRALTTTTNGKR